MAAQDIYVHFLYNVLEGLSWRGDSVDVLSGSKNRWMGHSCRINALAECSS